MLNEILKRALRPMASLDQKPQSGEVILVVDDRDAEVFYAEGGIWLGEEDITFLSSMRQPVEERGYLGWLYIRAKKDKLVSNKILCPACGTEVLLKYCSICGCDPQAVRKVWDVLDLAS